MDNRYLLESGLVSIGVWVSVSSTGFSSSTVVSSSSKFISLGTSERSSSLLLLLSLLTSTIFGISPT